MPEQNHKTVNERFLTRTYRPIITRLFCGNRYSDSLRVWLFGCRVPVKASNFIYSTPVQAGPGANPASCTMGRWSVVHPHLPPRLRLCRTIPLLPRFAFVTCYSENFSFLLYSCSVMWTGKEPPGRHGRPVSGAVFYMRAFIRFLTSYVRRTESLRSW